MILAINSSTFSSILMIQQNLSLQITSNLWYFKPFFLPHFYRMLNIFFESRLFEFRSSFVSVMSSAMFTFLLKGSVLFYLAVLFRPI